VKRRASLLAIAVVAAAGLRAFAAIADAAQAPATRGRDIYRAQCAECHGGAMEGSIGPPLSGAEFLAGWSGRPVADFVDKIQKTMPFNQTANLSRDESTDVASYIIETNKPRRGCPFPLLARRCAAGAGRPGNLAEVMRAIAFPNANIISICSSNPATEAAGGSPFGYVEGARPSIPDGWLSIRQPSRSPKPRRCS
jgi:cytochrome c5